MTRAVTKPDKCRQLLQAGRELTIEQQNARSLRPMRLYLVSGARPTTSADFAQP